MTREYINPPGVPERAHYTRVLTIDKPSKLVYIARPADGQNRRIKLSSSRYALHTVVKFGEFMDRKWKLLASSTSRWKLRGCSRVPMRRVQE